MFKFSPLAERNYKQSLICHFNTGAGNTQVVECFGNAYEPRVQLEPSVLCFKPTITDGFSKQTLNLCNSTNIEVKYEWRVPEQLSDLISVSPLSGVLKPNDVVGINCYFTPQTVKHYIMKICCHYSSNGDVDNEIMFRKANLTIMGQGVKGNIVSEDSNIDFGSILVNHEHIKPIIIKNPSDCDIKFFMYAMADDNKEESLFWFDPPVLTVPARSKYSVNVFANVPDQKEYSYTVYFNPLKFALENAVEVTDSLLSLMELDGDQQNELAKIKARGVFPFIQVNDIKCSLYSKKFLWDLFSLNRFNSTNDSTLDFSFFSSTLGSPPTKVYLKLVNTGVVDVDWIFAYPSDLEIETLGTEKTKITDDSPLQKRTIEFQLFNITPRNGSLRPGETQEVSFTYQHRMVGVHSLDITFRIKQSGKVRNITMVGETHNSSKSQIIPFHNSKWIFDGVPVGCNDPPIQSMILYNMNDDYLSFEIDTSALEAVRNLRTIHGSTMQNLKY
jgi:hypothetical protein